MKIALIKPYSDFPTKIPHLGLGWLATALRKKGHEAKIIDCPREGLDHYELIKLLVQYNPSLVGVSIFSADLPIAKKIIADAKKALPECLTFAGGPHPSCLPEHTLEYIPELDYVFIGEAEKSLPMLVDGAQDLQEIPGIAWRTVESIKKTEPYFEKDLDSLGLPSWDLLKLELQTLTPHGAFIKNMPVAPIITTRGCPFPCTFCAARSVSGKLLRRRSLDNVFEEIDHLVTKKGIREIHIEDDNFTLDRDYAIDFCERLLRRNYHISWCCPNGVRLDTLDKELLSLMKKSGCYSISVGIESGSNLVLKLIKKKLTTDQIVQQVQLIRNAGIKTTGFFIIGFPEETMEDIKQTIKFARRLSLDRAQFSTFLPLPGTIYFDQYIKQHEINTIPWNHFFTTDIVMVPDGISPRKMLYLKRKAFLSFYLRPSIIKGLIKEIHGLKHFIYIMRRVAKIFK